MACVMLKEGHGRMRGNGIRAAAQRINEGRQPSDRISPSWLYEALRFGLGEMAAKKIVSELDMLAGKRSETPPTGRALFEQTLPEWSEPRTQEAFRNPPQGEP